jgi:hypothetical protein
MFENEMAVISILNDARIDVRLQKRLGQREKRLFEELRRERNG